MEGRGDVGEMQGYGIHILREGGGRNDEGNGKYQADDDCLELRRNVKQERRLWGRLGEMIIRVGVNPKVVVISYRSVTHEVILFDLESWVLLTAM